MKYINNLLIYLRLKNGKDVFQSLDGNRIDFDILGKPVLCKLLIKKFNSSYYGDPYPYDWHNSQFNSLKRGRIG